MTDREKTQIILDCLKVYYSGWSKQRRYVTFPELRLGSGYSNNSQKRVDFFVIDSNAGNIVTGYEIKASRQDFLKDIKNPLKQRGARQYCNEFYYICLDDLIKPEEVPLWAGLIQLKKSEDGYGYNGYQFHMVVKSPFYEKTVPTWGLICAMVRKFKKLQLKEQQCERMRIALNKIREYELGQLDIDWDEYETCCRETEYSPIIDYCEAGLGEVEDD